MAPSLKRRKTKTRADIAKAAAKAVEVDPVEEAAAKMAEHRERLRERAVINELAGERSFRALLEKLARDTVPALAPPPANPVVELLGLVSPRVNDDGEDPNIFTRKELQKEWGMGEKTTIDKLHDLVDLGKAEPVMARRKGLHGIISVKAYRLKL